MIEKVVWKAKEENIVTSYKVQKKHITEETTLAAANFRLEQAKTGKRELEHLREQIEQLTKTNEKKDETIKEMRTQNEQLKDDITQITLDKIDRKKEENQFIKAFNYDSDSIIYEFMNANNKSISKEYLIKKHGYREFNKSLKNSLIEVSNDKVTLTEEGQKILDFTI